MPIRCKLAFHRHCIECHAQGLKLPPGLPSKNFPPLSSDLGADVTVTDILVRRSACLAVIDEMLRLPGSLATICIEETSSVSVCRVLHRKSWLLTLQVHP